MDRKTLAVQSRMIECLKVQPKLVYTKLSSDAEVQQQPTKLQYKQQGHVLHTDGRRTFCLRCCQNWNASGLATDKYEDIPCPRFEGMWKATLQGACKILGPQVHIGNKKTHPTHQKKLFWYKGRFFCIGCGYYSSTGKGGVIKGLGKPCQINYKNGQKQRHCQEK